MRLLVYNPWPVVLGSTDPLQAPVRMLGFAIVRDSVWDGFAGWTGRGIRLAWAVCSLVPYAKKALGVGVMDRDKRQLRKLKRDIKKAGNKSRRQRLKRELAENPEEAPHSEYDFGRKSSQGLNALDNDATRKKKDGGRGAEKE